TAESPRACDDGLRSGAPRIVPPPHRPAVLEEPAPGRRIVPPGPAVHPPAGARGQDPTAPCRRATTPTGRETAGRLRARRPTTPVPARMPLLPLVRRTRQLLAVEAPASSGVGTRARPAQACRAEPSTAQARGARARRLRGGRTRGPRSRRRSGTSQP